MTGLILLAVLINILCLFYSVGLTAAVENNHLVSGFSDTTNATETTIETEKLSESGSVKHTAETIEKRVVDFKDGLMTKQTNSKLDTTNTSIDASSEPDEKDTDGKHEAAENVPHNMIEVTASEYKLPVTWDSFCMVTGEEIYESEFTNRTKLTTIKCNVTSEYSGKWKMVDLRNNLKQFENLGIFFNIEITCTQGSNISVSWPMKVAKSLYKFVVKSCRVTEYMNEHNSTFLDTVPDSLRVFEMSSCNVYLSIKVFISMMKNVRNMKKEFDCIHETTIESLTTRDVTFDFNNDTSITDLMELTEIGEEFMLDVKRLEYKCDYKHLMHLNEGRSRSMSIYHMSLTTDTALFDQLRTYNISYSYLKSLQDQQLQWSKHFPKLDTFDLSHNDISKIYRFEVPLHTRKDRVTTINLQYNNITTITVNDLDRFKLMDAVFIDLRNNPIVCNCTESMKELTQYIKEERYKSISNLSDYSYIKELRCAGPERLKGQTLSSLIASDSLCPNTIETEYFIAPVIILSTSIVVLSVILFILLRFRTEVQIVLFTRFNIIIPCQTREDHDGSKKYDAFVSYSSNEDDWVEQLFEGLEKISQERIGQKFKFCLHHRDFIPGRTIFDNVIKSVESSRHTIILLSNHFLKSEYCLYEFQEAFRQSIMEQRRHLVIVMVEDIDEELLPRDLKRCIKTFTYIKKDDYLFTQRLVYALSVKQKDKVVNQLQSKSKYSKESKCANSGRELNSLSKSNELRMKTETSTNRELESIISIPNITHGTKQDTINKTKTSEIKKNKQNKNKASKIKNGDKTTDEHKEIGNEQVIPNTNNDKAHRKPTHGDYLNTPISVSENIERQCSETDIKSEQNEMFNDNITHLDESVTLDEFQVGIMQDKLTKLMIDYDRSMSTTSYDTGYGSDRTDKLSPDVCFSRFNSRLDSDGNVYIV